MTINRFCSSGLQAIAQGAAAIEAGWVDVVLAGGVESMSQVAMGGQRPTPNPKLLQDRPEIYTMMGTTSENVARRFDVSREDQDAFALRSHQKAARAQQDGRFADELVPVQTRLYKDGAWQDATLERDEGVRGDTSLEALGRLKPSFAVKGTTTPGNASQVSDGAAATLLVSRQKAESLGLPILATVGSNAPFLGLFGTVLGIIKALRDLSMETAGANDAVIAGISEALVATAVGLLVAIPAVVLYNLLSRWVKQRMGRAEALSKQVVAILHPEVGAHG